MRSSRSVFVAATLVTFIVAGFGAYCRAAPFWRISPQVCQADPGGFEASSSYSGGLWFAPSTGSFFSYVECQVPYTSAYPLSSLTSVWADTYVATSETYMELCVAPFTGGSTTCGGSVSSGGATGYVSLDASGSNVTWANSSTYEYDYPNITVGLFPGRNGSGYVSSLQGVGAIY
jgi:hypothetical protein